MANYAIVTDLNRCTGCLACTVACKAINGRRRGVVLDQDAARRTTSHRGRLGHVPGRRDVLPSRPVPALREPRMREGVPHGSVPMFARTARCRSTSRSASAASSARWRARTACATSIRKSASWRNARCASSVSRRASFPSAWPSAAPAPASSATSIRRRQLRGAGTSRQPRLPVRGDDPDAREAEGLRRAVRRKRYPPSCGCGQRAEAHVPHARGPKVEGVDYAS